MKRTIGAAQRPASRPAGGITYWTFRGRGVSTTFGQIRDGTSNTFMTGELQRITATTPTSKDGWAIGGPATVFTTGALMRLDGTTSRLASPSGGLLMNNAAATPKPATNRVLYPWPRDAGLNAPERLG